MYLNGLESCSSANGSRYCHNYYSSSDLLPSDVGPSTLWQFPPFGFSRWVGWVNILGSVSRWSNLQVPSLHHCSMVTLWLSHQQKLQLTILLNGSRGKGNPPRMHWARSSAAADPQVNEAWGLEVERGLRKLWAKSSMKRMIRGHGLFPDTLSEFWIKTFRLHNLGFSLGWLLYILGSEDLRRMDFHDGSLLDNFWGKGPLYSPLPWENTWFILSEYWLLSDWLLEKE